MPDAGSRPVRLSVEGLGKSYAGRPAIDGISFRVHEGEFVALLGPSGAGKSTLFGCVAGLFEPSSGRVRVLRSSLASSSLASSGLASSGLASSSLAGSSLAGSSLAGSSLASSNIAGVERLLGRDRRRVAAVFQQFNLIARRSALANVLAGRLGTVPAWRGVTGRFTRADTLWALECLDRVGLLDRAEQRADTLSGGQQQRVAIARALAQRPDILVADEPVASLDPQTGADILELLREICRQDGVAVVCSLHQVELARAYADRILGLAGGRIVMDVPAAAFDARAAARIYGPFGEPSR